MTTIKRTRRIKTDDGNAYDITTSDGETYRATPEGAGWRCLGLRWPSIKAIKQSITDGGADFKQIGATIDLPGGAVSYPEGVPEYVTGGGDHPDPATWDCVDPCAILGRLMLSGDLEALDTNGKIMVVNTLEALGWAEGEVIDEGRIEREFKRAARAALIENDQLNALLE